MSINIGDFLTKRAMLSPKKEALVCEDVRRTFSELNDRANKLAHAVRRLGVERGDRVGMLALKWVFALNAFYLLAVTVVGLLLLWGHSLARPNAPMAKRKAFFDASGLISMFYFVAVAGGAISSRW